MAAPKSDKVSVAGTAEAVLLQALELERQRIAGVLLGDAAQIFATVLVGLAALGECEDHAELEAASQELRDMVRAGLGRIQGLAAELRPSVVDDFGLRSALQVVSQTLRGSAGPQVKIDFEHATLALPAVQRTLVFRMLEEAIRNAVQHAHADHVGVSAEETPDALRFRVEDDGSGFDVQAALAAPKSPGGLQLMQASARALGGELEIDSRSGAGARVLVTIPRGGADG
jgi:signal transduction histidine kinase